MMPHAVLICGPDALGRGEVLDFVGYRAWRNGTLFDHSFRSEPDPLMTITGKRHWLGSDPHPLLGVRASLCGAASAGRGHFTRNPARVTCDRCLSALRSAVLAGREALPADDARRVLRKSARRTGRRWQAKQAGRRAAAEKVARILASRRGDAILI